MSHSENQILEGFVSLIQGLNKNSKYELLEMLTKSFKNDKISKEKLFFESFGMFSSQLSAEEIIENIKSSRKFTNKQIKL